MVMRGECGGTRGASETVVSRKTYFLQTAVLMEACFISTMFWSWKESREMAEWIPEDKQILPMNCLCCITEVSGDLCSKTNAVASHGSCRCLVCGEFWLRVN